MIALSDRDLARRGIDEVGDSSAFLVEATRPADKFGNKEKTVGFKLADGSVRIADKGFDYNVGRISYKPNLDKFPEKLAHQFAKVEMTGAEFRLDYENLASVIEPKLPEYQSLKNRSERESFLEKLRNMNSRNSKFAAGILSEETRETLETNLKTVWLSDDTLVKQIAHHASQFSVEAYELLPDVLFVPDRIKKPNKANHFELYKVIDGKEYMAVIKILEQIEEIYLQSFRRN